jgi:hypothetical protein
MHTYILYTLHYIQYVTIYRYLARLLLTQYVYNSNMLGSFVASTPSGSHDLFFKELLSAVFHIRSYIYFKIV